MEDKRIIKTKNIFKEALIELIKIKNISKITVSELCLKANINRNTFYSHYNYPEEVLYNILETILNDFKAIFIKNKTSFDIISSSCAYIKENIDIIKTLISDNCNGIFEKELFNIFYNRMINSLKEENGPYNKEYYKYVSVYTINGSISIMKEWIKSNFKEQSSDISLLIVNLTNYGVKLSKI